MAGKKQHFIPQHFLKPFVIPGGGDSLWMFRRGKASGFQVARNRAAAQEYYYSHPSKDTYPGVDDLVTAYEHRLHPVVDQIRSLSVGNQIDGKQIAEVVVHLAIRSSHIRGVMSESATTFSKAIPSLVDELRKGFLTKLPQNTIPSQIEKEIVAVWRNLNLPLYRPMSEKTIVELLYLLMRENAESLVEGTSSVKMLMEGLSLDGKSISKTAQTDALRTAMAPGPFMAKLDHLIWRVAQVSGQPAILPDCTSIAFDGQGWKPLLFCDKDELIAVVLPLAPDRLAVGERDPESPIDVSEFNEHAARSTHLFFLSSCRSGELEELAMVIGDEMRASISGLIDESITDGLDEFFQTKAGEVAANSNAAGHTLDDPDSGNRQPIQVSFVGIGDKDFAAEVVRVLTPLCVSFFEQVTVYNMDGITFAHDYRSALESLNLLEAYTSELEFKKHEQFAGVPITFRSNDKVRTRAILHSSIAVDLTSDDQVRFDDAQRAVLSSIASCALSGLVAEKFPKLALTRLEDPYNDLIQHYVSGVFEAYFCAAYSTINKGQLQFLETLAYEALEQVIRDIPQLRVGYRRDRDLEGFFDVSARLVADALAALSRLFGAYRCLSWEIPSDSGVFDLLSEQDLHRWANLFQSDLEVFRANLSDWNEFSEMLFVHRHFQRVLAHFQIVPDRTDGQGAYVYVS